MKDTNDDTNENNILLDDTMRSSAPIVLNEGLNESLLLKEQTGCQKFINKIRTFSFLFYLLIIIFMLGLSLMIYYIYYSSTQEPNFEEIEREWISPSIDKRNYSIYLFKNNLEVMLIQDPFFDKDGGAIVIEKGYLDNPLEEGLSNYITHILSYFQFEEPNKIDFLKFYYGDFKFEDEGDFITFRFDVLNNGFKKFSQVFSTILDWKDLNDTTFKDINETVIENMSKDYISNQNYTSKIENHLIEYLVYGFKNSNNEEILPEGNIEVLKNIDISTVKDYLEKLVNPSKIKIVTFSKYKFSLSFKYVKHNFRYLIENNNFSSKTTEGFNENKNEERVFNKSQLIFMNLTNDKFNYLKITYYIDKVDDEDYPELFYKKSYFEYISYFLNKKIDRTLYSAIGNNIKYINTSVDVVLKTKIQFTIELGLRDLNNITDVIYLTYQYIHKIINQTDEKNIQLERYEELKEICRNAQNLVENSYDTTTIAKDNAKYLYLSKYAKKYHYYFDCVPWNDSLEYNKTILYNKIAPYIKQLRPENSVIILGVRDKNRKTLTCNNTKFPLDCKFLNNESNFKETKYYKVKYKSILFNSTELENNLMNDTDNFNITFDSNNFKSQYDDSCNISDVNQNFINITFNENKTLNIFHFKRSIDICIQKVLLKFNLYHPFLRAKHDKEHKRKCYYFLIMEVFTAIKRKINEQLSDAISAYNDISFGQTENCLYIKVFCFSDIAYNISVIIKNILNENKWKDETDFFSKNYLYKNETFDEYFLYDKKNIKEISRFFFKRSFKKKFLFNYYDFYPEKFEKSLYNECIYFAEHLNIFDYFNAFAVEGYIYGYYTESEANEIANLFNITNIDEIQYALHLVNISDKYNDTNVTNYLNWAKNITSLTKNKNITINEKIYNKTDNVNYGISYRKFSESQLDISIFQNMLSNLETINGSLLDSKEIIIFGDQFCELIFKTKDNIKIPNEGLVANEWEELIKNNKSLTTQVDNIGNGYYYMIKNYIDLLKKEQASLDNRGLYEINLFDYNGTDLNKTKIIEEYTGQYNNKLIDKEELDKKLNYLRQSLGNYRVDVYTGDN